MRFSIITPTRNCCATLAAAMVSVLNQTGVEFEYLIVDGGSTDGTVEIIRKFADRDSRIRWVSEPDKGIADAFNKGLGMATGEWVGIINSDDCYVPGALTAVAEAIHRHPNADVIHGDMLRLDVDGHPLFVLKPASVERAIWRQMPLNHPATFVARRAYDKVGGFDTGLRIAMDYDLILRLYCAGARFVHLEQVLAQMRYGGASDARFWAGLQESRTVKLRLGYPRWRADLLLLQRWLVEVVKRGLRRCGMSRLLMLHPRFRRAGSPGGGA